MRPQVHDLTACTVVLHGTQIPSSSDEGGEFIAFSFPEEFFTASSGDGTRIRSMNPARGNGTATITVHRHSVAHKRLGLLYEQQKAGTLRASSATFPDGAFRFRDHSTGDIITAESAAIQQAPSYGVGVQAGTVEWVIDLARCSRVYGTAIIDAPTP